MNIKIYTELENLLFSSPHLLFDKPKLYQAIKYTFGVSIPKDDLNFSSISRLVNLIDTAVLHRYFGGIWTPQLEDYKHSGLSLIPTVNSKLPSKVLDIGCAENFFKGKINNLIGLDPYCRAADIQVPLLDYKPDFEFDAILALGSINFGTVHKVVGELSHAVNMLADKGVIYLRFNPGIEHTNPASKWIQFFPWNRDFILNVMKLLNLTILTLEDDSFGRIFVVAEKPITFIKKYIT
ncbi:MAG: class I SAM-dependent methyltransferase [Gammaproteobacteria bacterium]|nr:class I SAM-dependent methyltransferase [Gammaproteobacteria bacterium]